MSFPRTRRILGNGPAMKPQLSARYGLQAKATAVYRAALKSEYDMNGFELNVISEAVIERVIQNFKRDLSPRAADVVLPEAQVIESMLSDAAVVAEQMDESGELDRIMDAAQRHEDAEKHGI